MIILLDTNHHCSREKGKGNIYSIDPACGSLEEKVKKGTSNVYKGSGRGGLGPPPSSAESARRCFV